MDVLAPVAHLEIDWELTPDEAVVMYMEQPDCGYSLFPGAAPEDSVSRYFVLDTWERVPVLRLLERNREVLKQLVMFPLPEEFMPAVQKKLGLSRGMFPPPAEVLAWLKQCMGRG